MRRGIRRRLGTGAVRKADREREQEAGPGGVRCGWRDASSEGRESVRGERNLRTWL